LPSVWSAGCCAGGSFDALVKLVDGSPPVRQLCARRTPGASTRAVWRSPEALPGAPIADIPPRRVVAAGKAMQPDPIVLEVQHLIVPIETAEKLIQTQNQGF
jgi:hypothetical protein